MDTSPRKMTAEQYNVLNNFAELAIRRLEDKHYPDFKVSLFEKFFRTQSPAPLIKSSGSALA